MQKPTKEPRITYEKCTIFFPYDENTSEDLRRIADIMDEKKIKSIYVDYGDFDGCVVYQYRMESNEEAEKRYTRELKQYDKYNDQVKKNKEKEKEDLIKRAKQLGLKISE